MTIISTNDQAVLNNIAAFVEQAGPLLAIAMPKPGEQPFDTPEKVKAYRTVMEGTDQFLFPKGFRPADVGSYEPKRELKKGLTAGIAIPKGAGPFPVIVHAHGHGLRAGRPPEYEPWTRLMATYGFVIIFPDYRWQPESSYQDQIDDMGYTLEWVTQNARTLKVNTDQMILGGDSVGAMLAFDVLLRNLASPNGYRFKAFACVDGLMIGPPAEALMSALKPETSLPPIYIEAGSGDFQAAIPCLRLAQKLFEIRKFFQFDMSYGMPHDFIKMVQMDAAQESNRRMMQFLQKALT